MSEGIKLYRLFRDCLRETGPLKLAWFTTFNLSLSFFEKYILAALCDWEPEQINTLYHYEAINEQLFMKQEEALNMDVRIFYDYRALDLRTVKKTSVKAIPVNPDRFGRKFVGGIFHPKICLLVNRRNEGYLLAGSANLTLSGWGKNSESVVLRKIADWQNAHRIADFFREFADKGSRLMLNRLMREWKLPLDDNPEWKFTSSFDKEQLLLQLAGEKGEMYVWSPYFSEDIISMVENDFQQFDKILIVPDIAMKGSVRIRKDVLERMRINTRIGVLRMTASGIEQDNFIHAKIWLTQSRCAIGSWNFTSAALGIGRSGINIEAGVILSIDPKQTEEIAQSFSLEDYSDQCAGLTEVELKVESEGLLHPWKFSCHVICDWQRFSYEVYCDEKVSKGEYFIKLPGLDKEYDLKEMTGHPVSFIDKSNHVLRNRLFHVTDSKGEKVFMGLIIEKNIPERPVMGFDNINDFFRGWIDNQPEIKRELHRPDYFIDAESVDGDDSPDEQPVGSKYEEVWFSMFIAMENMKQRLGHESKMYKELKRLGYHIPGSVAQLRNHMERLKEEYLSGSSMYRPAFIWFMLHEGNLVIRLFNELSEKFSSRKGSFLKKILPVNNIDLPSDLNNRKGKKWIGYIIEQCGYVQT